MPEDQQKPRQTSVLTGRFKPLGGLICLLLVALFATIQTTHFHPIGPDASPCPLCIVMHSAAPVAPATAVIVLVPVGLREQVFKAHPLVRFWRPKFFTRPPPAGC